MIETTYKYNTKINTLIEAIEVATLYNSSLADSYLPNYISYSEGTEFFNNRENKKNTLKNTSWDNFHDYIKKHDNLCYGLYIGYQVYKHQKYYKYQTSYGINTFLYSKKTKTLLIKIRSDVNTIKNIEERKSYKAMTRDKKFQLIKIKKIILRSI